MFYQAARHLPGVGGVASWDELTIEEGNHVLTRIRADLEAERKAIKGNKG